MSPSQLEPVLRESAPALLGYFVRRVEIAEDAADLVNETMIAAWKSIKRAPDDATRARMWLFGIARNILAHHARAGRRRDALVDRLSVAIGMARSQDRESDLDVRAAIASLSPELAEIIRLVHWDGFSLEEVAILTGTPASTVRGRHAKARQLLRERLAPPAPALASQLSIDYSQ